MTWLGAETFRPTFMPGSHTEVSEWFLPRSTKICNRGNKILGSSLLFQLPQPYYASSVLEGKIEKESQNESDKREVIVGPSVRIRIRVIALGVFGVVTDVKCVVFVNLNGRFQASVVALAVYCICEGYVVVGWVENTAFCRRRTLYGSPVLAALNLAIASGQLLWRSLASS
jgi:hypothetical protein